jgi:6,7-dimethyl-8-ribityllumazine synthase
MLRKVQSGKKPGQAGKSFAIVASQYNAKYVDAMLRAAVSELKRARAKKIQVIRVPGAFEIPAVASALARTNQIDAIICLGVIFQGQTSHAEHIGWGVTHALAQIQVQHALPVVHGVFVFEKEEHARVRCLGKTHNRGREAALTALQMAGLMDELSRQA